MKALYRNGRLNSNQDIASLWTAIEDQIKGGKVGDKVSPELGVDRNGWLEKFKGDSGSMKEIRIEILPGGPLDQKTVGVHLPANLDETPVSLSSMLSSESRITFVWFPK